MSCITYCNSITFLAEWDFEQQKGTVTLPIPPFMLVPMLCVLCSFRLGDMSNCQQSLTYLQTLLLYGDRTYVALDIWETFLGSNLGSVSSLCRTTMGCYSLIENIYDQKKNRRRVQKATETRIGLALQQLRKAKDTDNSKYI